MAVLDQDSCFLFFVLMFYLVLLPEYLNIIYNNSQQYIEGATDSNKNPFNQRPSTTITNYPQLFELSQDVITAAIRTLMDRCNYVSLSLISLLLQMDIHNATSSQAHKQLLQGQNPSSLQQLIDSLASQSLRSSEKLFNPETHRSLSQKFSKIDQKNTSAHFLAQFVSTLLTYTGKLKHELSLNTNKHDYEKLEQSMQKSQAEIRKHIKIEQQLKLYLDSLEESIQQLKYKLQLEEEKYLVLFENFKELDESHKKLTLQINQSAQAKKAGHQYEFKSIQLLSGENVMSRKTKLGLKSRLIMDRLQQRTRKTNERKQNQLLSITEDEANLQAEPSRLIKGNSIDRYKKEGRSQYSIKELTKSLQMKHERSMESYNKKISKNKTDINAKEGRSNSIMS